MAEQFVKLARKYLALIDGLPGPSAHEFLSQCAILLPQLYYLGQQLPDVELPDGDPLDENQKPIESPMGKIMSLLGKYDRYCEVFDPIFDNQAITTHLSDDLSDIYTDLKRPLVKYDSGEEPNQRIAIWEWAFHLKIHWGNHLVDALRPIHSLVHDHLDPEFQDEENDA
jgi:hypothetical protein